MVCGNPRLITSGTAASTHGNNDSEQLLLPVAAGTQLLPTRSLQLLRSCGRPSDYQGMTVAAFMAFPPASMEIWLYHIFHNQMSF